MIQRDDVQHHQVLALVLVDSLDLHVEHPRRVQLDPRCRVHVLGQAGLVGALDVPPALPERRIVDERLQAPQPAQIGDPAGTDGVVEQLTQARVGQRQEPARRHPVGDVAEAFRPHLVEVLEHAGLQQLRVQRRHPVDRVAAHRGQMRHPDALAVVLADQRHPPHPVLVTGEALAHLLEEPLVDLVDQFQVPRQRLTEDAQRPGLQRLGQQGVIGVAERAHRQIPRRVPRQLVLVDEQPHQFRHRDRRVGVVELDGPLVRQRRQRQVRALQVDVEDVLQRARHEEVLLQQP